MKKINFYLVMKYLLSALFIITVSHQNISAQTQKLSAEQESARSIFKELIEINTTHSVGNTTMAANAMAKRFLDAGFDQKDIHVFGPQDRNQNMVIRFHGSGKAKPILFISHLDVVEARREDWSLDPFQLTERDGYFYGRGTLDIKDGAAILVANFLRLKKENFTPDRDLILALTAGEEGGSDYDGIEWLIANHRDLIDAEFCVNMDAGDPQIKNGKRINRTVQPSEKAVLDFSFEVKNRGGHSSLPVKNNAIYHLADGLAKLEQYNFPADLNEITRAYFGKMATIETGQLSADMKAVSENPNDSNAIYRLSTSPYYNALLRTTCVATRLEAGHAITALPQYAKALVNCRVMPGAKQIDIQNALIQMLADTQIVVTALDTMMSNPPSPLKPELMQKIESLTKKLWPGVVVMPVMQVGASDGLFLRGAGIPTYGISGVFINVDDNRAHGKDERIGVKDFYDGLEYEYYLIKMFSTAK